MYKLCFDYGHGGRDPGAIYKGREEKNDVLKIGRKVVEILRKYEVEIDETRKDDKTLSLKERSDFERRKNYDYFISFHRNSYRPEEANGVETYTYLSQTVEAKELAEKIQKALVKIGFGNRGVKKGNYHVLRETRSPAILLEIGFIDNSKDNKLFDNKFSEIANSIAEAIVSQLGIKPKESETPKTLYRVMAGSFANKENAEKQVKRLKDAGFDAVILNN